MKPGKKLNAFVAKHVMNEIVVQISSKEGNELLEHSTDFISTRKIETTISLVKGFCIDKDTDKVYPLKAYSTNITEAWRMVESLPGNYFVSLSKVETGIYVTLNGVGVLGETQAHGLCLAALKIKGIIL